MKISLVGVELFHADSHGKPNITFCKFVNMAKNMSK